MLARSLDEGDDDFLAQAEPYLVSLPTSYTLTPSILVFRLDHHLPIPEQVVPEPTTLVLLTLGGLSLLIRRSYPRYAI